MRFLLVTLVCYSCLSACDVTIRKDDDSPAASAKIRNGITFKTKGINVTQAFLQFDDGTLVPQSNKFKLKQTVRLVLIGTGWTPKNDRVFLDASERVETSEGDLVLDSRDLFREYADGVSAKDAEYLSLDVVLNRINKLFDYYKVSFQIKDKSDPSKFVEGQYKLYLE